MDMMNLLNSVLQEKLDEYRADGLSDSEIVDKIAELKIENVLTKVVEAMSSDAVDTMETTMYERIAHQPYIHLIFLEGHYSKDSS